MIGLGTIANTAAVIIGGLIGLIFKKGLKESIQDSIMRVLGVSVIFLGVAGAMTGLLKVSEDGMGLETTGTMLMILSLVIGVILGELLKIEDHMETLGEKLKALFRVKKDTRFVEGFVTNALIICVGAMAVVGSLQDGLTRDASMLYAKAILDGMITIVFAASFGVGAIAAAIPLFVYQGGITLLAGFVAPYLTDQVIHNLSYVGSILITCTGINMLFDKRVKVGNMLPALVVVLILGNWL